MATLEAHSPVHVPRSICSLDAVMPPSLEGSGQVSAALNTSAAEKVSHNSARNLVSLTKVVMCSELLLVDSGEADMGDMVC